MLTKDQNRRAFLGLMGSGVAATSAPDSSYALARKGKCVHQRLLNIKRNSPANKITVPLR